MNYRHAYHAGNFADVVKHSVFLQLITYLQKKPTPYCIIDTHAGEGFYALNTDVAQKTNEAAEGIGKLLQAENPPTTLADYLSKVRSIPYYPGSPWIAAKTLRANDKLILNEKHLATYQQLKQNLKTFKNVAVHQRDAYEFLPAILPPALRGLVLIDPAFEVEDEIVQMQQCLSKCFARWPQGIYLIWLPIVGRKYYTALDLLYCGFQSSLTIEFTVKAQTTEAQGLIGCSLLILNPPWKIEETLTPMLEYLWQVLHVDESSHVTVARNEVT